MDCDLFDYGKINACGGVVDWSPVGTLKVYGSAMVGT